MAWTYAINAEIYNTLENNPVLHFYNMCMLYIFLGKCSFVSLLLNNMAYVLERQTEKISQIKRIHLWNLREREREIILLSTSYLHVICFFSSFLLYCHLFCRLKIKLFKTEIYLIHFQQNVLFRILIRILELFTSTCIFWRDMGIFFKKSHK